MLAVSKCTLVPIQELNHTNVAFVIKGSHTSRKSEESLSHMVEVSLISNSTKLFTLGISLTNVEFVAKSSF
jgi:hypothetical protein